MSPRQTTSQERRQLPDAPRWWPRLATAASFSLLAIGVHAAADRLDEQVLATMDWLDAHFDALVTHWQVTAGWADWLGVNQRTTAARSLMLLWELLIDGAILLPATVLVGSRQPSSEGELGQIITLMSQMLRSPWRPRVVLCLVLLIFVLGGTLSIARLVHGDIYLAAAGYLPRWLTSSLASIGAFTSFLSVLVLLGPSCLLRLFINALTAIERNVYLSGRRLSIDFLKLLVIAPLAIASFRQVSRPWGLILW